MQESCIAGPDEVVAYYKMKYNCLQLGKNLPQNDIEYDITLLVSSRKRKIPPQNCHKGPEAVKKNA